MQSEQDTYREGSISLGGAIA
ncbi:hypothetical protein LCGC14_2000860, partial [marine sediment metagenome]